MTELLRSVIEIAQNAEDERKQIEDSRNIPSDIMEQVKEAGLVKMWCRKECGGKEISVSDVVQIISEIAYYNGSLAWVTGVTNCSSLTTGFVSKDMAMLLFGRDNAMIGGFAGPAGVATKEGDALNVSGRWSWGSGVTHCSHIVGGVRIMDGNKIIGTAVVFLRPDEVTFHDNWHVLGLKGTHSIDYSADSVLIPKERWTYFPVGQPDSPSPLYRFSFLGALSVSVAAVGSGLAKRAIDEIKKIAQTKSPFGQGKVMADRPDFQEQMAKTMGQYHAAQALLKSAIQEVEEEVISAPCSTHSKAKLRLAAAHATTLNSEVVTSCYRLASGSSIWEGGKLEELLRDMNVVSQHGMVNRGNYRTAGAVALGKDVPEVLL